MVPVLKVNGEAVAKGKKTVLVYRQQFEIAIKSTVREKELVNNVVIIGSFYNVDFDYQIVSEYELKSIAERLKGEILNFVAKSYFAEMYFKQGAYAANGYFLCKAA